ncbi:MAG: hypothetical protein ACREEE_09180, partial [Dongiaceae bacterium]
PDPAPVSGAPAPYARRRVYLDRQAGWCETAVYHRDGLRPGHRIAGPAIITQRDSTILVLPDQAALVDHGGVIRIRTNQDSRQ